MEKKSSWYTHISISMGSTTRFKVLETSKVLKVKTIQKEDTNKCIDELDNPGRLTASSSLCID